MMRKIYFLAIAFALSVFAVEPILGQSVISGKVVDAQGTLPGVNILIKGTLKGTITDVNGDFSLYNVPAGKTTLIFKYVGYAEMEREVNVVSNQRLDMGLIRMSEDNVTLAETVVTATYRPSQARALNLKKTSNSITEVLASDAIGKLPDRNAAEAVQRIQGVSIARDLGEGRFVSVRGTPVQWSAATLNGNRLPSASGDFANRSVQMDIFPSELIQFVKVHKALTPDIDGDAIGGSIDFITRTSVPERLVAATAAAGSNTKSPYFAYNSSLIYGDKVNDKLSFITSAVIWNRYSGADNHRIIFDFANPDPVKSFSFNQFQLRNYTAARRTIGFNGAMDYKINQKNKLYFKGLYSQYYDAQTVYETYFNIKQKNIVVQNRHADYITDLYSVMVGGESKPYARLELDYALLTARSTFKFNSPDHLPSDQRGYPIVNFIQRNVNYGSLSSDGLRYLKMDSPNSIGDDDGNLVKPDNTTALNAEAALLNQVILARNKNSEKDYRAQFNVSWRLNEKIQIKSGFKAVAKDKNLLSAIILWMPASAMGNPTAPKVFLSQLDRRKFPQRDKFFSELGSPYGNVLPDPITNKQIDELYKEGYQTEKMFVKVQGENAPSNQVAQYGGNENVYAVYAMADYEISSRINLLAGIRNEYNQVEFSGKEIKTAGQNIQVVDVTEKNYYNNFLPMVHLRYSFNSNTLLRLAYTQSFARPDFSDLNPGSVINEVTKVITKGNVKLRPTSSINYDLMFEHYFSNLGIISFGAFYKDLKDVIYRNQSLVVLNGDNYLLNVPENLNNASALGLEFGLAKRFTGLPGIMSNFGIEGNYSFIDSEARIPVFENGQQVKTLKTTLPQQAKHIFNLILFYESKGFMARLAGNYKGAYVNTIRTISGPEHYEWFDKNLTIDFTSSYSFNRNLRLFLETNNITNEPNRFYHGTKERIENLWYFGSRAMLGLQYKLD
jgi:TonB-dependent receptor